MATTLGQANPFRYRSYFYDTETNLYYLQSRYYDPNTGRFINADDTSVLNLTQDDLTGGNLYAYCGNCPVMNIDINGYSPASMFFNILLTVITIAAIPLGWRMGLLTGLILLNIIVIGITIVDYHSTLTELKRFKDINYLTEKQYEKEKSIAVFCYYATLISCGLSILLIGLGLWVFKSPFARTAIEVIGIATGLVGWTVALTVVDVITTLTYKSRLKDYRKRYGSVLK